MLFYVKLNNYFKGKLKIGIVNIQRLKTHPSKDLADRTTYFSKKMNLEAVKY